MDPTYGADAAAYRDQVQAFLRQELPSDWTGVAGLPRCEQEPWLEAWRSRLHENRLLAPAWPEEYGGGGLSPIERVIVHEEFTRAGAPLGLPTDGFGVNLIGPTIIAVGTEEQKRHYLPRILSGEDRWCQGYSEPDAGSDLAGLGTRAELDGDEWVINGQKIWTSEGHHANWIFVLCRTAPAASKHQGISFLLCPMDQAGVEVRPIVNAAGSHDFNEVFFSDARTARDCIIGEPHQGWRVTNQLLMFERGGDATTMPLIIRALVDRLVETVRERGRHHEPIVRQRLADLTSRTEILRYSGMRTLTTILDGSPPGPESSINKLAWSELYQDITVAAVDLLGANAAAHDGKAAHIALPPDTTGDRQPATWVDHMLCARPASIYSGSNEIQRNIVGERVLGLAKEPRADEGPWNQTRR